MHDFKDLCLCQLQPRSNVKHPNYLFRVLYDLHTLSALATMFSQAQSVHASRDLSYAVTFSYLLSMIRKPCRHVHLNFLKPSRYMHLKYVRKPMQSVHASREYQTQSLFTCISLIRIPCVCFAYHVGTASI